MYEPLQIKEVTIALGDCKKMDLEYQHLTRLEMQKMIVENKIKI